jgi:predicted O-linked N-acetylglucosamine transferase (SPINDLY family)
LHLKARQYDWQEWHGAIDKIKEEIMQGIACALPFHVVTLIDDVVVQRQAANVFLSNQRLLGVSDGSVQPLRSNHQRVRLAYLSCDFYDHATSHLMWALLREHDRVQFEVWVFGWGEKSQDPMHQTIQSLADRYVNLSALSDEASVSLIRSHQIDVAIDLKGYTHGARAAIFAQRCAPIQIAYLGYPATTGMAQIDYIVADHHLINAEEQSQFSEKILWMPTCYQVNSGRPLNTETDCSRPEWGLPEDAFVFASFNRGYKLTPDCFASWMNILQAAPHSVLWLLEDDIDAQRHLVEHVQAAGVAANRLIFCKSIGHDAHLLRIQLAQVCLDTFPCGGHTTTSDVLRAGVPLVTYRGQSWMSRVSSSLLYALGLDDWVTTCVQDYQDWAIRAAQDPSWLNQQRQRLQVAAQQSSLFDVVQWTRDFEQLLTRVVDPPPP